MKNAKSSVLCYVRTHRKVWGLTQQELATLVGLRSASHISKIEHGKLPPSFGVALACQVIFGLPPSAMFPHVYSLREEEVMRNIYQLHLALNNPTSLSGLRKGELCNLILSRAVSKPKQLEGI